MLFFSHLAFISLLLLGLTKLGRALTPNVGFLLLQELLKKCHQCMETIVKAKDQQAAEANKNASILLKELDLEKVTSDPATVPWKGQCFEYAR